MPAKPLKPDIKPEAPIEDLSQSFAGLGESTTAAELVRTKGQSKKLKVITEKQLMEWVNTVISRHLAGKVDSISDQEKEEMLKKVQDELAKRIKREQDAQAERDRMKADLDKAMSKVAEAQSSAASREQADEAIENLKRAVAERDQMIEDLQQEKYDLTDQLAENRALASTTLAEKNELKANLEESHKQALMNYMRRANALVEGVLGLDNQLYGGRHFEENPVPDDATAEEQFYHEYEVGAKVIDTLSNDLQRLRGIAQSAQKQTESLARDPRMNLLESDLSLLEQLKGGSLAAVDVAEPVEGLVEAMNGARTEAQQLEHTGKQALGVAAGREDAIAAVPSTENGSPAEVLAGTTGVVRELAAVLARGRQRMVALKEMADQADEARNSAEEELGEVRKAYHQVLNTVAERAKADKQRVPTALVDEDAPLEESSAKASDIIKNIKGGGDIKPIISEQLVLLDRLLGDDAGVKIAPPPKDATDEDLLARLREDSSALARMVREKSQALTAAEAREKAVAEEVRALARTRADITPESQADERLDASVVNLNRALDDAQEPADVATAAQQVIHQLREQLAKAPSAKDLARLDAERAQLATQIGQAQQRVRTLEHDLAKAQGEVAAAQSRGESQRRSARDVVGELVRAAKGDEQLAESVADLSVAMEAKDDDNLLPALREAVTGLTRRKQDLSDENQRLRNEVGSLSSKAQEAESRLGALASEQQKLSRQTAADQNRVQELERDLSRARTDLDLMRNQAQEANSRRTSLEAERSTAFSQLTAMESRLRERETELAKARAEHASAVAAAKSLSQADRAIATELVAAAQGDAELADVVADLALSLEDTASSENAVDPATVSRQVAAGVAQIVRKKHDLSSQIERLTQDNYALKGQLHEAKESVASVEAEYKENMASGKEVINHLTQQNKKITQELAEKMEESRGQLAATKRSEDNLNSELASLRASIVDRDHQLQNLAESIEKAKAEQSELLNQVMEQRRMRDDAAADLKRTREELRLAQAEVADFQARDGASSGHLSSDLDRMRQEANRERAARAEVEDQLAQAQEHADAAEARLKTQRDELTKRLAERDHEIDKKDRQLKDLTEQRADTKGLEARVSALTKELEQAHEKIKQYETEFGAHAGNAAKSTDLAREMKNLHGERDQLREKLRQIEGDLADANSALAQKDAMLAEKRKAGTSDKEKIQKEILDLRDAATVVRDENRKLKEENAGLKARIRRLTEGQPGSGPSGGFKTI
jgi:chromosome segregation ATPase